jgi:class 3 adenylate cyclase
MQLARKKNLLLFALPFIAGLALMYFNAHAWLDQKILDWQFQTLREHFPRPLQNDVVVVGIDEDTFKTLREPFALWHPHLGKFLRAMAQAKPAALGLDVVLPDRSYHFLVPQYDQPLLQGLMATKSNTPLFLAQTVDENGKFRNIFPPYISIAGKDSLASVMVCLDEDGIVRRFDKITCPTLELGATLAEKMAAQMGSRQDGSGLVDFAIGDAFTYIPFKQVLSWFDHQDEQRLATAFRDRPVILGVTLPFLDRLTMPVPLLLEEPMNLRVPGVFLHAQTLRSLLSNGLIRPLPETYLWLLAAVASLFWFGRNSYIKLALAVIFLFSAAATSLSLLWRGIYLPIAGILISGLIAYAGRAGWEMLIQIREKRFIRNAFSSYVSPQILKEIMAGRLAQTLGGTRKNVCVLFSDIRNFTTYCENKSPEEVISLLNEYFSGMTDAIHKHGGTVDKFIGDGIMAFFGAPQPLECAERNALESAQDMLVNLQQLNEKLATRGIAPIKIGIGLNSGEVVIGHVGSSTRHEYTAVGDVVNTASRIEGLTKEFPYPIMCSKTVAEAVNFSGGLVDLGKHAVIGRADIQVYGWKPAIL